ncbi:MAG: P-loop NTPase [Spirochaetia bacterium]
MNILPIASGKGGVGKTSLAANLAVVFANAGKKVILVDLDLGGSNLHLLLGHPADTPGIGSYVTGKKEGTLKDLIVPSGYKGVDFIPGDSGIPGTANIRVEQKRQLIRELCTLEADYLILDLGAGSGFNTIDFFLLTGTGVVITAPTSAAIAACYLFLKNVIFRIIVSCFSLESPGGMLLQKLKENSVSMQTLHIEKLIRELEHIDPDNFRRFSRIYRSFHPRFIINMLDEPKEAAKGERLRKNVSRYLGLEMDYIGVIFRDETQSRALSSGLPITVYKPTSIMSQGVERVGKRILSGEAATSSRLLSPDQIEASYQIALSDAEADYQNKVGSIEDLFRNGDIGEGDLLEILRNQQFELNQLRKENRFLKRKLHDCLSNTNPNMENQ